MAKAEKMNREGKAEPKAKKEQHAWSGHYGSTKEMIVRELPNNQVVCQDERGEYVTHRDYIGAKMLDPLRMYRRTTPAGEEVVKQESDLPVDETGHGVGIETTVEMLVATTEAEPVENQVAVE